MNSEFALTVIIKSTIVLFAAVSIAFSLRKAAASIRHVVWTAALVSVLLLPILAIKLPTLELRLLPPPEQPANPAATSSGTASVATPPSVVAANTAALPRMDRSVRPQWSTAEILFLAWLTGAVLVGIRSVIGFSMIRRLLKQATAELVPERQPLVNELLGTFALRGRVTVRLSDCSVTPMTAGLRSSAILLPAEANDWPEERLRFVLAHELAHVKRRDTLMQIPIQIACSLHWFNPLVWIAHRRFLIERERACDDFVINSGAQPDAYADHLLDIARSVRHKPRFAFSGIFMANRSQLETRLLSILDKNMNRTSPNRIVLAVTVMAAVILVVPIASVQLRAQESKQAAQAPTPSKAPQSQPAERPASRSDLERALQEKALTDDSIKAYMDAARRYHESGEEPERKAVEQALENYREAMKASQFDRDQFDFNSAELGRQAEMFKERIHEWQLDHPDFFDDATRGMHTYDAYFHSLQSHTNPEHLDQAVGPLTDALLDSNSEVRGAAARALGELRDPRAVVPLLKALADEDSEVREHAATALGEIRDTTAASALIKAVKDPNPAVREQAIRALANMRSTDALSAVLEAMKDADPSVRKAAVEALAEIVKQ